MAKGGGALLPWNFVCPPPCSVRPPPVCAFHSFAAPFCVFCSYPAVCHFHCVFIKNELFLSLPNAWWSQMGLGCPYFFYLGLMYYDACISIKPIPLAPCLMLMLITMQSITHIIMHVFYLYYCTGLCNGNGQAKQITKQKSLFANPLNRQASQW